MNDYPPFFDKDAIAKIVEMLPLLDREPTVKLLNYSSRTGQMMGFVYAARAFAFGNRPKFGAAKAIELYHYLLEHQKDLDFGSAIKFSKLLSLTVEAAAHGSYIAGDYDQAIARSEMLTPLLGQETDECRDEEHRLTLIRFQALLRLYRLDEAISLFDTSLADIDVDALIGADAAFNAGHGFMAKLLDLPSKHGLSGTGSVVEKSEHLWTRDYDSQIAYLSIIRESYEKACLDKEIIFNVRRDIQDLISLLNKKQATALSDLEPDVKREQMGDYAYRFQKTLRKLLMDREEGDGYDQNLINESLSYSHRTLCRVAADSKELLQAHQFISRAKKWAIDCRDAYGLNDLLWTRALLYEKQKAYDQCAEALEALVDFTITHFQATCSTKVKAALVQRYPGIAQKLSQFGTIASIFRVCELRRGIILHEQRGFNDGKQFDLPTEPNILGQRTHYLCFSCLPESDDIVVSGYLASGKLLTYKVNFGRQAILAATTHLDPSKWKSASFRLSREINPPKQLNGLLEGLASYYNEGDIIESDHLCIAADEPINRVPFHYLEFQGEAAIRYFSFSRVVSFADARWIYQQPLFRYTQGSAFFVPCEGEKEVEAKRVEFRSLVTQIAESDCVINRYEDIEATWAQLIGQEGIKSLFHLQLHGEFPSVGDESNPYQSAGLLMARDGRLPKRLDDGKWTVTPEMIKNDAQVLTGSHITLSACVSGLSKQGQGGDLLGLELMFFMKGASSVLASHWDVESVEAIAFTKRFYRLWLKDGMSRAQAWRQAMLQSMDRKNTPDKALEQCGFSLFGNWR